MILYGSVGFGRKTAILHAAQQLSKEKRKGLCLVRIDGMVHLAHHLLDSFD